MAARRPIERQPDDDLLFAMPKSVEAPKAKKRPRSEAAPGPDGGHEIHHRREDHDQVGLPDVGGEGQQQPGDHRRHPADLAAVPHQHDQRGGH